MHDEEKLFKNYVTDSLYYMQRNQVLSKKYRELLEFKVPKDNRTGDEIAMDIIKRHNLKVE